jgi:hypothetical protein
MCLTHEAYQKRKWQGLNMLRFALGDQKIDDSYYGWSTASYNIFERIRDILEIGILVSDNLEKVNIQDQYKIHEMRRELMDLVRMLETVSCQFSDLSKKIDQDARVWFDKAMRSAR